MPGVNITATTLMYKQKSNEAKITNRLGINLTNSELRPGNNLNFNKSSIMHLIVPSSLPSKPVL